MRLASCPWASVRLRARSTYVGIETSSSPAKSKTRSSLTPTSESPASKRRNVPASSQVPPRHTAAPRLTAAGKMSPACTSARIKPRPSTTNRTYDEKGSMATEPDTIDPRPAASAASRPLAGCAPATKSAAAIAATATSQPRRTPANAPLRKATIAPATSTISGRTSRKVSRAVGMDASARVKDAAERRGRRQRQPERWLLPSGLRRPGRSAA